MTAWECNQEKSRMRENLYCKQPRFVEKSEGVGEGGRIEATH